MRISKTPWSIFENDDAVYIVPKQYKSQLNVGLKNQECSLNVGPSIKSLDSLKRGTVLLTMNQSDIYEQLPDEMLTFILEGVDVMVYNNPGKGLSTGSPNRDNINASIEASYKYLKSRGIPDKKILAKGQCFGGAPTAWLGKKHPHINIMLDQNPANFYETAIKKVKEIAEGLKKDHNISLNWLGGMLLDNFIVNGIARAILSGYDIPGDISHNKGHKLLNINVPSDKGKGGDQLIPTHHPELMIDAMQDNPDKIISLSMNPGAKHVTDWWDGEESQETVIRFLNRTELKQSLF